MSEVEIVEVEVLGCGCLLLLFAKCLTCINEATSGVRCST